MEAVYILEYIVVSLIFIVLVPLLLSLRMIKMEISLGHMVSDIALRGKWNTSVQVTLLGGSFIYSAFLFPLSSFPDSNQMLL